MRIIELVQKNRHIKLAGNDKLRIEREFAEPREPDAVRARYVEGVGAAGGGVRWGDGQGFSAIRRRMGQLLSDRLNAPKNRGTRSDRSGTDLHAIVDVANTGRLDLTTYVLDTNYLKAPELQQILASGADAQVMVPFEVIGESLRAPSAELARGEHRTLSAFPQQVFVLKPMALLLPLDLRRQADLIDLERTVRFRETITRLDQTPDDYWVRLSTEALKQRDAGLQHFDAARYDLRELQQHAKGVWGAADLKVMRSGKGTLSPHAKRGLVDAAFAMAECIHADCRLGPPAASKEEWLDRFAFRYSICHLAWLLGRLEQGATSISVKDAMNDVIDTAVCAYATYFSAFCSLDFRRAQPTFTEARQILAYVLRGLRKSTYGHLKEFTPGLLPP